MITNIVTFELLAAFVADEIWGFKLEPARSGNGTGALGVEYEAVICSL